MAPRVPRRAASSAPTWCCALASRTGSTWLPSARIRASRSPPASCVPRAASATSGGCASCSGGSHLVPPAHHRGGTGEPVVLIHGVGSQWQVWQPVLPALERERDVVALDLPGSGDSPSLPIGVVPNAP